MPQSMTQLLPGPVDPLLVCALGVQDADLEGLRRFFESLGNTPPMAVVVLQAPGFGASVTSDQIQEFTSMPVVDLSANAPEQQAMVYLVKPGSIIESCGGVLRVRTRGLSRRHGSSLDGFFRNVAECYGERAAAVLLSQPSSDGTLGLESIVAAGGVAMIVGTASVSQPSAGDTGSAAGIADVMGSVHELTRSLLTWSARGPDSQHLADTIGGQAIREICERIEAATGHDFRHYKQSTLSRRIWRRMGVLRCEDVDDYLDALDAHPDEARHLSRDLLIGVTAFFRDGAAFEALQNRVIDALVDADPKAPLRVWVAGCGTGQEAYSIAILALEALERCGSNRSVQIFATDLDDRALAVARRGSYPSSVAAELGAERVAAFFEPVGRRLRANKRLRQCIVFSSHNLIANPPLSRMDLISCRNLLIYLGVHLQKKLMSVFHYALNPDGYLFLGSSEAVTGHEELFRVIDAGNRIAQRKASAASNGTSARLGGLDGPKTWQPAGAAQAVDLGALAQRILLDEFSPPYAIANGDAQIQYLSAGAETFLQPAEGQYVNNLVRMTRNELRVHLRKAWARAVKQRRTAKYEGITIDGVGDHRRVRITVQPMPDLGEDSGYFMVVFNDLGLVRGAEEQGAGTVTESERLVEQLEQELLRTRQELERVVQDLEAANEELKSSNEELLSINEELHSANEELAASKDEIEAGLVAVSVANGDLTNLLRSTEVATLFLDQQGRIRHFTPPIASFYNVTANDIGRPISHFTPSISGLPPLWPDNDPSGPLPTGEVEARLGNGRSYLRRITAYRDDSGRTTGSVVMFVDVTEQRDAHDRLADTLAELETIYRHAPVGLALIDRDLTFLRINEELAAINGLSTEQHIGRTAWEILPALAPNAERTMQEILDSRLPVGPFEIRGETPREPGVERTWMETWTPILDASGQVATVSIVALEITERKAVENVIKRSRDELQMLTDHAPVILARIDRDFRYRFVNRAYAALYGKLPDAIIGRQLGEILSASRLLEVTPQITEVLAGNHAEHEVDFVMPDGRHRALQVRFAPETGADGAVVGFVAASLDVTEQRAAQAAVVGSEARLRRVLDNVLAFIGTLSPGGVLKEANRPAIVAAGLTRDDVIGKPFWDCYWWSHSPELQQQLRKAIASAANGSIVRYDVEIRLADDIRTIIDFQISPNWDAAGSVTELVASGVDISERKATEMSLADNLTRLREAEGQAVASREALARVYDTAPVGLAYQDRDLRYVHVNEQLAIVNRKPARMHIGRTLSEIAPEMGRLIEADMREVIDSGIAVRDREIHEPAGLRDEHQHWWLVNWIPDLADDGRVVGLHTSVQEITDLKVADAHRELLIGELNHRVKNSLATIQAMASQTLRNTPEPASFRETFIGRLRAIAAAHDTLTQVSDGRARMASLIASQVGPYAAVDGVRVRPDGPDVELSAPVAHALGMVLHELATNAAKYGALSKKQGYVKVVWRQLDTGHDGQPTRIVELEWIERDGPPVVPPSRKGFGTRMIESSLSYSLGGDATLHFEATGLRASIRVSVEADYD